MWISVKDELPPLGRYVLIHHTRSTWKDSRDQDGVQYDVALREAARQEAYQWVTFGPTTYFGQEIDFWMPIERIK